MLITQVFVMHVSGVEVSFYWATFPSEYLKTVRLGNLSDLKKGPRITLHHSEPRSLLHPRERNLFLEEFVSILRCVAEGYGKVGYLRRDKDTHIHRGVGDKDMHSETGEGQHFDMGSEVGDNGSNDDLE
jgi:hypothetical protein